MSQEVIERLVVDFEKIHKEFQEKAKSALQGAFKEFFDSNPRIESVEWTQYSPYFNDGDECTFSVHEMYANVVGREEIEDFDEDAYAEDRVGTIDSYWKYHKDEPFYVEYKQEATNFSEFVDLINRIPDDIYEATFGNHVQVIANREGFDVDEYSHD